LLRNTDHFCSVLTAGGTMQSTSCIQGDSDLRYDAAYKCIVSSVMGELGTLLSPLDRCEKWERNVRKSWLKETV
jgi:hypothetical protein